ncbi:hypothetical protein BaRGS_00025913 [Batillaria attramentaria]|uniref:Uncharacterized protein n=1 Tax=Batillaria attramentaria TaxID=370345 RepID=A0ABD0K7K6_9CAEN
MPHFFCVCVINPLKWVSPPRKSGSSSLATSGGASLSLLVPLKTAIRHQENPNPVSVAKGRKAKPPKIQYAPDKLLYGERTRVLAAIETNDRKLQPRLRDKTQHDDPRSPSHTWVDD